ncbi:hypothetical protein, partial [Aeromonas veronii]|uniref:hypothetical protein n=1 Tax=Aeromonas veronii TaxID=654 RepID=UPI003D19D6A9
CMETRLDHRRSACSNFINKVRSRPALPSVPTGKPKAMRVDWLQPLFKSKLESEFYQALKNVFPTYFIYPNVALSNIFDFDKIQDREFNFEVRHSPMPPDGTLRIP